MKHEWEYKKLDEICSVAAGQGAPQGESNYSSEGTPFIKAGNLVELINGIEESEIQKVTEEVANSHKLRLYPSGSILFAKSGMSCMKGYVYTTKNDCYVVSHLAVIIPQKINSYYLNYFFQVHKPNQLVKDEAYPSISLKDISTIKVPYPSKEQQQSIVSELDSLSQIIADCKETLKDYDALEQSIFYDMFGDITDIVPLSEYVNGFTTGKSLAGEEENKYKVLKSGAVTYDEFDSTSVKNYPLDYNPDSKHLVKKGDLLVSRMNTAELVGACAFVWDEVENLYLPDRIWKAILNDNCNPIFVWKAITASDCKRQIRDLASGTSGTMKNISMVNMLTVKVKKVDLSLQQAFASKMEFIRQMKTETKKALQEAETLFNARMDYWFN